MNEAATVHVAAANCFGLGYGFCNGNTCTVVVNVLGRYHVHVYGDRADQAAQDEFAKYGTEYDPLVVNAGAEKVCARTLSPSKPCLPTPGWCKGYSLF